MIIRLHLDNETDIIWATPTSGYGHVADEQPLPYIHQDGMELTPRFGGEASLVICAPETAGLPHGILAEAWSTAQRRFNFLRRPVNLYWRNIFQSHIRPDRRFLFLHQLDFKPTINGFIGTCPLLKFKRNFELGTESLRVQDTVKFIRELKFLLFHPVVVPLFDEWGIGSSSPRRLECDGFRLESTGIQRSSAGTAKLWAERMECVTFSPGDYLERNYTYHWAPGP